MFKNAFKVAVRSLLKNKGYSFLNIFGLAIGIACAGLIFLWVGDELTFDNVNLKKNNLYEVKVNSSYAGNNFTMGSTPRLMASTIKTEIPGIAEACRVSDEQIKYLFSTGNKALYVNGLYADPSMFRMFTLQFTQGSAANPFPQLRSLVLTEKTAGKLFGTAKDIIGKTVRVANEQDYVITGVVKDMPENSSLQFEWLIPYEAQTQDQIAKTGRPDIAWNSYGPFTYVELSPSANLASVNSKLYHYISRKDQTQKTTAFLFPMSKWRLYSDFANGKPTGSGRIRQVKLLSTIAAIILLIACINFMNLATARSEKRAKEIGVRKVLGSGRKRLIFQFIGEAMLMSAIAAVFAAGIMALALPAFNTLVQKNLALGLFNPAHLLAALLLIFVCGLLAGSYPSLYLSSFKPVMVLKGLKIKSGSATLVRQGLVVLQFAASVVFIIGTIVIYLQMEHAKNRNLGLDKDNLVEIDLQRSIGSDFAILKHDLLKTGAVQNAAYADHVTLYGGDNDDRFTWEGKEKNSPVGVNFRTVSAEYIATSGMHIEAGHDFTGSGADTLNVIVNHTLARIIDSNGVVGKVIRSPRDTREGSFKNMRIIGVVSDYMFGNMFDHQAGPVLLFCNRPNKENQSMVYVRIKNQHNSQQTLADIAAVLKKDNPAFPFQYKFVDDQFNQLFADAVQVSKMSSIFATLAIVISCLGLFSLAAYTAERRVKEIGIRKVLGASAAGIAGLLSKDFLKPVSISCLIAFPVAWIIMHSWLQAFEYRITIHWWIFAMSGLGAISIAVATISFQAIKSAVANPVVSLRSE
jgi:putative ABC transport system permease protein